MISKDFKLNFKTKTITHNPKGTNQIYTFNELYSYLQNLFDEPINMKYGLPISADSKKVYSLINGWKIDKKSLNFLKGGILATKGQAFRG